MTPDKIAKIAALAERLPRWNCDDDGTCTIKISTLIEAATALAELLADREETRARVAVQEGALKNVEACGECLACAVIARTALKEPTNGR